MLCYKQKYYLIFNHLLGHPITDHHMIGQCISNHDYLQTGPYAQSISCVVNVTVMINYLRLVICLIHEYIQCDILGLVWSPDKNRHLMHAKGLFCVREVCPYIFHKLKFPKHQIFQECMGICIRHKILVLV